MGAMRGTGRVRVTPSLRVLTRSAGSPDRGPARWSRAAGLSVIALLLATGAHLAAGGTVPPAGLLAVSLVLVSSVAVRATARRCGFGLLLMLLAVEQVALHLLWSAASAGGLCSTVAGHAAHAHAAAPVVGCAPHSMAAADLVSLPMLVAHVAATIAVAALAARGERYLWRLVDEAMDAVAARPRVRRPRLRDLGLAPTDAAIPAVLLAVAAPRGPPWAVVPAYAAAS